MKIIVFTTVKIAVYYMGVFSDWLIREHHQPVHNAAISVFPRRGSCRIPMWNKTILKKLWSNFPTMSTCMWCQKSLGWAPGWAIKFVIFCNLELPDEVSIFPPLCLGALSNSWGLEFFCCLIPLVYPPIPLCG